MRKNPFAKPNMFSGSGNNRESNNDVGQSTRMEKSPNYTSMSKNSDNQSSIPMFGKSQIESGGQGSDDKPISQKPSMFIPSSGGNKKNPFSNKPFSKMGGGGPFDRGDKNKDNEYGFNKRSPRQADGNKEDDNHLYESQGSSNRQINTGKSPNIMKRPDLMMKKDRYGISTDSNRNIDHSSERNLEEVSNNKPFDKPNVKEGFLKPSFKPNMYQANQNYAQKQEQLKKEQEQNYDEEDFEDDFEMDNDGGMKTEFTFDLNVQGAAKDKNIDLDQYEEQKKRVSAIKNVIQLETEGFEQMSTNSATLYQNYVAKQTNGNIRNCAEQTNEENRAVECQTTIGEAISAATQFPDINLNTMQTQKQFNDVESGGRLRRFQEVSTPQLDEMIQFSERQLPTNEQNNEPLKPPEWLHLLGRSVVLVEEQVAQKSKNEIYCIYSVMGSEIVGMEQEFSLIIGYINLAPTNFFFNSEKLKSITLNSKDKIQLTGDNCGMVLGYDLDTANERIQHVPLTNFQSNQESLKDKNLAVYMSSFSTDPTSDKNHFSPVVKLLMVNKEDLYSMDDMGNIILWNLKSMGHMGKSLTSLSQLDLSWSSIRKDFCKARLFFYKHTDSDHIYVTNGQEIFFINKFLAASRTLQIQNSPNCIAEIRTLFLSKHEVIFIGYNDGSVRQFMKTHKDPLMTLENFSDDEIVLLFPANYAKLDSQTNELNILECMSSLNVLDSSGKLHIFDLDEDQNTPVNIVDLLPKDDKYKKIIDAKYNMKSSILTASYMHGDIMNHLSFNMRGFKKKISKLTIIRQSNEKLIKLLRISFVNN